MKSHIRARAISHIIAKGFELYLRDFRAITLRARYRFENRNWQAIQGDSRERLSIYKERVMEVARQVQREIDEFAKDEKVWTLTKSFFAEELSGHPYQEIAETYFNSVCRKVFTNIGVKPLAMFVTVPERLEASAKKLLPIYTTYSLTMPIRQIIEEILNAPGFRPNWENFKQDVDWVMESLEEEGLLAELQQKRDGRIEMIHSVFYRNKGAYLVGRIVIGEEIIPLIFPLMHGQKGIYLDTLVTDTNDVSIIFSFTRSYFLVEVERISWYIDFLKSLMPQKLLSELYNSLGFNKHGKTMLYRELLYHMEHSADKFVPAAGIKGMVMSVFTLPSYPVVFKLIKDKFAPPKKVTRQRVKECYEIVKIHDRVGRMADTHEFENFAFPLDRISNGLMAELQEVAPSLISIKNDQLVISHLYTERRMMPLNLFLEQASEAQCREAVGEYGNAIKQLAAANIFPGDMLLKNFGVTRHRRVIFYDYDE
ncbi:MAG: bifunctional isocitrate dehydrogenase kinase/phosphatase, partial [Bacteroidota bacterium]